MADSTQDGTLTAISRAHDVPVKTVKSWVDRDGMPADLALSDEWLKRKGRGKYKTAKLAGQLASVTGETGRQDLRAILDACQSTDAGVKGLYQRAVIVEQAAFLKASGTGAEAADVTAFAKAQATVAEAASLVAKAEEEAGNLRPMGQINLAIKHQWQTAGMLLDCLPESVADMLVGQPRKVVCEVLRRLVDSIKSRLLETYPFTGPPPVDVGDVIVDPTEEELAEGEG